jgi:putative FmdB family regulatory protein
MPIYEYACMNCGSKFELMRAMKDADVPVTCGQCQGEHTVRLLSLFNAQSGGRVVAGSSGCASCSSNACATCGSR